MLIVIPYTFSMEAVLPQVDLMFHGFEPSRWFRFIIINLNKSVISEGYINFIYNLSLVISYPN